MKQRIVVAALPLLALAMPAFSAPPAGFDARVDAVREAAGTPGMAIAIVEDGQVTLARGYGVRKLGAPQKVDADTVFMIGSTAKAMTAAALATLVDAGKLGWDDKVIDRLPGFQMYDAWVTREMTVRDLLVHRSGLGLGAGDMLYVPRGSYSRAEIVRRLRYIRPATSFRSAYAYDNVLYIVAGQLLEAVSGQTWEDYVREHIFKPAGMKTAAAEYARVYANANRAQPHARYGGAVRGTGMQRILDEQDHLPQSSAPAGLVGASANDMARWLQIQLAQGAIPGGGRLFSEAQAREMWTPVTPIPIADLPAPVSGAQPSFQSYALGWEVRDYRGHKIVWHAGGLYGLTSVVVLIPEKKVGFAIELNSEEAEPRHGLMYELLDHYLGLPGQDWPARFRVYRKQRVAAAERAVTQKAATPAKIGPSLPLARYAGRYVDPWYGPIDVTSDAGGLTVNFVPTPRMAGRLEHYQYDSFITRFDDPTLEPAYLTFAIDAEGKVARITTKAVSPIADFSFDYGDLAFEPERAGQ
ncbi:serine hydrolase [Sphingomonas sp. SRS2]|uniref:serine hydrolase n=1 Tax=Sphingomonas sp. SRS2 TaxID=133190 RepID=UPI000618421A|nr:serine hydrolase [Sphingomonas sp. SRS2]KKC26045.1 beta-lactamase [Sphingomonas sp. SRS2]